MSVTLFFAIFFSQDVVGALPIAIVDEDNTSLSRKVTAMIRATPQTSLVKEMPDMATARNSVLQGKVVAVVEIPKGFSKAILSGQRANVMFYDSGANISTNSLAAKGIQTALTTFGVGVSLQRAEMQGVAPDKAMAQAMPIRSLPPPHAFSPALSIFSARSFPAAPLKPRAQFPSILCFRLWNLSAA